jgi:chemosensory pili system protein ChpC
MLTWRDRRLPVVSFELASDGESGRLQKSCRIAIVNTLNGNTKLPYFGLLMQSLPSLQIVRPNGVQEGAVVDRPSIKASVTVNGTPAVIPDLDDLEARLLRLLKNA